MPKATTTSDRLVSKSAKILFVTSPSDSDRAPLVLPKALLSDFNNAIELFKRKLFANNSYRLELILTTCDLSIGADDPPVEISEEAWAVVLPMINTLRVDQRRDNDMCQIVHTSMNITDKHITNRDALIRLRVTIPKTRIDEETLDVYCPSDMTFCEIAQMLADQQKPYFTLTDGHDRLASNGTPREEAMYNGYPLSVRKELVGGKPVIYLFSPAPIDASVRLSLVKEWKFSVIYPVTPIVVESGDAAGQTIQWSVRTTSEDTLVDTTSGRELSYLFWEATTDPTAFPSSPPASPGPYPKAFNPRMASLSPSNSVVLQSSDVTPYLDDALSALGLHTSARNDFITYWLPAILKHERVALRFLPQAEYEQAAVLHITPSPDIVSRIFMLFQGIPDDRSDAWSEAVDRAQDGPEWWRNVVGVDQAAQADPALFRVLEWGGMEV